jgi:hypothetical protein
MRTSDARELFVSLIRLATASPLKGGYGESPTPRATGLVNCYGYQILTALGDAVAR